MPNMHGFDAQGVCPGHARCALQCVCCVTLNLWPHDLPTRRNQGTKLHIPASLFAVAIHITYGTCSFDPTRRVLGVFDRMRWLWLVRITKLLTIMVLIVHWLACMWHFMYEQLPGEKEARDAEGQGRTEWLVLPVET